MRSTSIALSSLLCALCFSQKALAHCEIPCGIYGDETRFAMIVEDVQTIEKSMTKIGELSGDLGNVNQLTRWVNNKEHHADHIREIVTQYFMTQRIKIPPAGDDKAQAAYEGKLVLLHKMLVYAMKCKQTTDLGNARILHDLTHEFKEVYSQ